MVAAFDVDEALIGKTIGKLKIQHLERLPKAVADQHILLAILAVPAAAANLATDVIVQSGISGILNFAPVTLKLPDSIGVVGVDLAIELEQLAFGVAHRSEKPPTSGGEK